MRDRLRAWNERSTRWAEANPVRWWLVLFLVVAGVYAATGVVVAGDQPPTAIIEGAVFGVVFATVYTLAGRIFGTGG